MIVKPPEKGKKAVKGERTMKKYGRTMLAAAGKTVMALFMTLTFASTVFAADPFSPHWEIDRDQVWHYRMNDGSYASDAWIHDEVNGDWYLLDVNGNMLAGTFVSYGKYYLLDPVRGTGHYGRLLKNGHKYRGIVLEASTDLADEGALSQETLNAVNALGGADSVANAVEISGTKHIEAGNVISAGGVPELQE